MAEKQLILLRHAKSDWFTNAGSDHDRPLSDRGRRDAPRVGAWLSDHGYQPGMVLCSTAERARETLDLVMQGAEWPDIEVDYLSGLYLASESKILECAMDALIETDSAMIVGHNPGMDYALTRLCPHAQPDANYKLMTTAAFAVIGVDNEMLENPVLEAFHRPKEL